MDNKVIFTTDNDETVEFHVLEQTKLNGNTYLLVTDANENDEEGNAYILKAISEDTDESVVYDVVEDEKELGAIAKIFEELLDDVKIETE
ncbi:DUF1292 domain-containing protein [Anaerocolumna sp.]|uniref:DUF1292 domain-containing protein n=1 Tax=Anaerocolumna sp. TaxID=2041569 RepID=UPI0028A89452|nr:DUF1292 domain-containing protein [Anaerocolumna sp.]